MKRLIAGVLLLILLFGTALGCRSEPDPGNDTEEVTIKTAPVTVEDPDTKTLNRKKYRVIYNSDCTHIEQNESPYHAGEKNTPLTANMVKAAVQEAIDAGTDCFTFSPGSCWVPWWPSQYIDAHIDWYVNKKGGSDFSSPFWQYVHVRGKDMIQDCIDVCHAQDVGFFISFRLNDHHYIKAASEYKNISAAFYAEIFVDHPEYAIGYVSNYNRTEVVLDFQYEPVVQNRMNLIRELIENYDLDGFELDFTRRYVLFNVDTTTSEQRLNIMLGIIKETRRLLDEKTAADGKFRDLSVRIPVWNDYYDDLGIDLAAYAEAGVTIFNVTGSFWNVQERLDIGAIKRQVGDARVYFELHFITAVAIDPTLPQSNQGRIHRRATVEQLCTTAMIAYDQGADGISFFNFQYYRGDRGPDSDRPYTEPPWEVVGYVRDPDVLLKMNQHYYFGKTWRDGIQTLEHWALPVTCTKVERRFNFYLVRPETDWAETGVLSIQTTNPITNQKFTVTLNGVELEEIPWEGKPYPNVYTQAVGSAEDHRSFRVPGSILNEGRNEMTVKLASGNDTELCFVELAIHAK